MGKARYIFFIVFFAFFFYLLFYRFADLGEIVTADETYWLLRGTSLIKNLTDFNLSGTLLTVGEGRRTFAIQGVITRWVVGVALFGDITSIENLGDILSFNSLYKVHLTMVLLSMSLMVVVSYLFAYLFRNKMLGVILFIMLFVDGFVLGLSRVAHVDMLLSFLMLISMFSMLLSFKRDSVSNSFLSGITAGMAIIQKAPALSLIPFLVLVAFVYFTIKKVRPLHFYKIIFAWVLALFLGILVFYPATIVIPMQVVRTYFSGTFVHVNIGGGASSSMNLENYAYIIRTLSFYFYVIMFKTNPLGYLGVFTFLISLRNRSLYARYIKIDMLELILLASFILIFLIQMSFGSVVVNRYILPAHLVLLSLASYGVYIFTTFLIENKSYVGLAILLTVFSVHVVSLIKFHPHYLAYRNPFSTKDVYNEYDYGWGTGINKAMDFLYPHLKYNAIVYTHYPAVPYFKYHNSTKNIKFADIRSYECIEERVNYLILHIPLIKAYGANADLVTFLRENNYMPIETIILNDLEYAYIYKLDEEANTFINERCSLVINSII